MVQIEIYHEDLFLLALWGLEIFAWVADRKLPVMELCLLVPWDAPRRFIFIKRPVLFKGKTSFCQLKPWLIGVDPFVFKCLQY